MNRLVAAALPIFLCTASLTLAAPAAFAADSEDDAALKRARKFFKKGEKLFALGRFAEALGEYQRAFEEYPLPEFLFNIGQCHRNLGAYDEAIFSFRKYLRLKPDAVNREGTEELITELEEEKARTAGKPPRQRVDPIPGPTGPKDTGAPVYKTWWFWTGLVIVGAATTAFVLTRDDGGVPGSDLGNVNYPR